MLCCVSQQLLRTRPMIQSISDIFNKLKNITINPDIQTFTYKSSINGLRKMWVNKNTLNQTINHTMINTPEVTISEKCMERMETLAWSATKSNFETGGYFFGYCYGVNSFLIAFITGPGEKAKKSSTSFIADAENLQKKLNHINDKIDVDWIGSWHVHPTNYCNLSHTDMNSFINTVNDPECRDFFVAMVFSAYGDEMKVKAFIIKKGQTTPQEANIRYMSDSNIKGKLLEDAKLKPNNIISTNVKTKLENMGFNNLTYESIDSYHIFKGNYNNVDILLFIPINNSISPNLFVNDELFFVPINWNDLCTIEDFIDSIELNKINIEGGTVTKSSYSNVYETKFHRGVRRRRRVVCHNRNSFIFIPLRSPRFRRLVSYNNRYRKKN